MSGSATFTTVTSRISISWATQSSPNATQRRRLDMVMPGSRVAVVGATVAMAAPTNGAEARQEGRLSTNMDGSVRVLNASITRTRLFMIGGGCMATTRARSAPPVRERRADARRNVAAILDAAQHCLARDPDANVSEIAQAAGVGRVTLYGHFKTRADLVDAVLARTVAQADAVLDTTDTTGDPREALTRLIASTWQIVDQFRSLLRAAQSEL